ncbi:MAG: exo-alpha-sialidase [Lachnospiraceae bacterium]|nr:exo-alpha-sialidase [Lachnospiraceae bacterium]
MCRLRSRKIISMVLASVTTVCLCSCYNTTDPAAPGGVSTVSSDEIPGDTENNDVSENKTEILSGNEMVSDDSAVALSENIVEEEPENGYADKHIRLTLPDSGWDVFSPSTACLPDYRYGPSMMLNNDGSIDAWFSAPGDGYNEFDWITYRHSDDGGETWSSEKVAISPSPCSPDALSTCDPDVFYYDGYYYLGYTSTINRRSKGICNSVFLARSVNPDGPYEKWDGSGWGGSPVPIVYFDSIEIGWGCGEPSFVVVDDTVYVYSTKDSYSGVPDRVRVTEVRTADITDPDWPGKLEFQGYAGIRNDTGEDSEYRYRDSDSWDVAYIEESQKFVAVSTNRRFKQNSSILYYESNDGIMFERVSELNTNVVARCHNCGIMADGSGHIKKDDAMMIGYAYGGSSGSRWGVWSTRFAPLIIDYTDEPDRTDEANKNLKVSIQYRTTTADAAPMMLSTDQLIYCKNEGTGAFKISYFWQDNYKRRHSVPASEIEVLRYDPDIVSVDEDNSISPKVAGITWVTVGYEGLSRDVCLCVMPREGYDAKKIMRFYPITGEYSMALVQPYIIKVRPMAVFGNYRLHELAGMDFFKYGVTFESEDTSICEVYRDGTVIPVSVGDTVINVKTEDGIGYSVNIHIY